MREKLESEIFRAEESLKVVLATSVEKYLLGREVAEKFLNIVRGSLACQELTSRDVQEGHTKRSLAKVDGCEEIVLLIVQHIV